MRFFRRGATIKLVTIPLITILLFSAASIMADPGFSGRVVHIASGDTMTVAKKNGKHLEIRLGGIAAPEWNHPYAVISKQALARLVYNKEVRINVLSGSTNTGIIGHVYLKQVDINAKMILQGHAWIVPLASLGNAFDNLEKMARTRRKGLWNYKIRNKGSLVNSLPTHDK